MNPPSLCKTNKYAEYLKSRLHPDTEKYVKERAGSTLVEAYLELLLQWKVLSQKLDRIGHKNPHSFPKLLDLWVNYSHLPYSFTKYLQ